MNKYLSATLAASLLAFPSLSRADDTPLTTDKDKVSYTVGIDIGRNLQMHGIDVNPDALVQGLKDYLAGGPFKMTPEQMQATMEAFNAMQQQMQAKVLAQGPDNKKKGEAYLEANKKKDGWKVTSSGLQYKIITSGTGPKPAATDTVVTEYRGTTIDGAEFDSSYKHEPAEFPVNGVIPGWTEALQMMPVGSKWQLAVPANLAYGDKASPQIGPNSVLLFDIELVAIKPSDSGTAPGASATSGS